MRAHLTLLGVLQLTWGAAGLLLGASTLILAFGAAALGFTADVDRVSAAATAIVFGVFAAALLAGGLANAWAGAALRRHRPAGRFAAMGLAVPNLFLLPFGTALGIYAFWVLLHEETRRQFGAR